MQENKFEKQVKQMMDEFNLQPSNDAWPKIDRRINGDRGRKTPFILLLVSCLLVSGFIMYRYELTTADNAAKNNAKDAAIHSNKTNALTDSNAAIANTDAQTNKKDTAFVRQSEKDKNGTVNILHTQSHSSSASTNVATQKETRQPLQTEIDQPSNAEIVDQENKQAMVKKENAPASTTINDNAEIEQQQKENKDSSTAVANNNIAKAEVVNDNILNIDSNASVQQKMNKKNSSSSNTTVKLPKLQWGINAFFGGSNAVNDLVSSNKSLPSSLNSGGGNFDTAYSNKPYNASTAYHIGFVVEKRIIKNGFIGTGLNYVHLSTKSTVGMSIDSTLQLPSAYSINNFYQSGTTSTYTNHYNFIELPVYFRQDLFPTKKLSLSYNAGFSLRQLLSTNSLVYDQNYNIYFSKDDALNKTQFQLLTGLSLKINSVKNTSIYIGPQFSYSLSGLFKNNNSNNFHFITYGLQAGLLLHKK